MRTFMFYNIEDEEEDYCGRVVDNTSPLTNYEIIKRHIHIDEDGDVLFNGDVVNYCRVLTRDTPQDTKGHFFEYKIGKICEITVN